MPSWLAWLAAGLLLLLAVLAAVATRLPRLESPVRRAVAVAEGVAVLVVVVDLGLLLRSDAGGPDSLVTHVGYAVASVGLIPALVWRAPAEDEAGADPGPASLWVVAVALAAVAACLVRLAQTR